jgi:glyoxalase-like protein
MCYAQPWFRMLVAIGAVAVAVTAARAGDTKTITVLNLDHASICGSDLDALQGAFADAGLKPDYGGPHTTGGTHMAFLGFDDGSYLELIAPQTPGSAETSPWGKLLAGNAGPCAWAVSSDDLQKEVDRLRAAGLSTDGPIKGSRKRPDGLAIEWLTAQVGRGTPGSTLPFMIEDRTPREWRVQTSASVKESPLAGIDLVVLAVSDMKAAVDQFRKAYGWSEPLTENHGEFGAKMAYFPGEPVLLVSAIDNKSWINERLQKVGETPIALLLATQDFDVANKKYHLSGAKTWFGQRVAWFDPNKLKGIRLGVIGK